MLLHGNLCYKKSVTQKCCSSQVSTQDEYTLPAERETSNALVVVWSGNEARHGSRNVTLHRQRLSAYSRDSSQRILDSRLYPSKRSVAHIIRALIVSSCVVSSRVLRRPHQSPFRVLTSRMVAERAVTPYGSRQYIMTTTDELIAWAISKQARRRESPTDALWA